MSSYPTSVLQCDLGRLDLTLKSLNSLFHSGVPSIPKKEAVTKLSEHKYALSQDLILRIVDETEKIVELFDEKGKSVNSFIKKILTSEVDLPVELPILKEKPVRNPWNETLFTEESNLSPGLLSSFQLLPVGTVFRAIVLYVKSPTEFFICSEENYKELRQFQVIYACLATCNSNS